jgi:hypothetical protein
MIVEPTPLQSRFCQIPEKYNIALVGGRGGGKTTGVQFLVTRHLTKYGADAKVLIIRETFKALQQMEDGLLALLEASFPGQIKSNRQDHIIRIAGGGMVEFGQLESYRDIGKYQGREVTLLVIEEMGLLREIKWVALLKANMRSPADVPLSTIITANPGGLQHQHIHKTYISSGMPWVPRTIDGEPWVVAPSTLRDNPHLDQEDYRRKIIAACGHDLDLARAWELGDWNIARGAFFAGDLDESVHMLPVALPFAITNNWIPQVAIDWGQSAPSCCLFHGRCPEAMHGLARGSIVVFDEVNTAAPDDLSRGLGWPPGKLAEAILETAGKYNMRRPSGVIDDAQGLHGNDDTLINLFSRDHGIYLRRPKKGRTSGWSRIKEMLSNAKERNGKPGLYLSERCGYLWQTMPFIPRDPRRPEDVDTNGLDHGVDSLRYAVTNDNFGIRSREVVGHY